MTQRSFVAFVFALAFAAAGAAAAVAQPPAQSPASPVPAAAASPANVPSEDPKVTTIARAWLGRFQSGNIDHSKLGALLSAKLTPKVVRAIQQQLQPLGNPTAFTFLTSRKLSTGNATAYAYRLKFANGTVIDEIITIDGGNGLIDGLFFRPEK